MEPCLSNRKGTFLLRGRLCERCNRFRSAAGAHGAATNNHKKTPEVVALGDFDVLAITPDGARAWIVEAKDLKLCRTIGETARRLAEYEGKMLSSGKPDKMMRHLRRVAYAREHARDLQKRLGLPCTPKIAGIMIVRAPQPMESISLKGDKDARAVMLTNVAEVPWSTGWSA